MPSPPGRGVGRDIGIPRQGDALGVNMLNMREIGEVEDVLAQTVGSVWQFKNHVVIFQDYIIYYIYIICIFIVLYIPLMWSPW